MDVLAGAMGNLAPKLLQLLQDEYNLTKELKEQVKSVSKEMKFIKAALEKLGEGSTRPAGSTAPDLVR